MGVGTVAGNAELDKTTENTLKVLEVAEAPDIPVAKGAPKPLINPLRTVPKIHGEDGLGNTDLPKAKLKASDQYAADQIIELAREYPGEVTLIPTGPLTNIAIALFKEPKLAELIKQVVLMGGAARGLGNLGPVCEANIGSDPEAAKVVFHAGWPITMVGLDVTLQTYLTDAHIDKLKEAHTAKADFVVKVTNHLMDIYKKLRFTSIGERRFVLHDPLAVGVALDPSLVKMEELHVDVETKGELTRGMTVVDLRPHWSPRSSPKRSWMKGTNCAKVCLDVDSSRFIDRFIAYLTA